MSTTIADHARLFASVARAMERIADRRKAAAEALREAGPAKYPSATVYRVKGHNVAAHYRAPHVAVRYVRRAKPAKSAKPTTGGAA